MCLYWYYHHYYYIVCVYIYIYIHMCVHIHIHVHIYIYICIYTYPELRGRPYAEYKRCSVAGRARQEALPTPIAPLLPASVAASI